MTPRELPALTIAELRELLREREVSPREAVEALHARIDEVDPEIGAYLSRDLDAAVREAENAQLDLPLGGVPIALKDNINLAGQPCTCASKILRNYSAQHDATVVQKLRAAGGHIADCGFAFD